MEPAKRQMESGVDLIDMLRTKQKHKGDKYNIKLGPAKIEKTLNSGIATGREVVELFSAKRNNDKGKLNAPALSDMAPLCTTHQALKAWHWQILLLTHFDANYHSKTSACQVGLSHLSALVLS